jgi:hypothetical protein
VYGHELPGFFFIQHADGVDYYLAGMIGPKLQSFDPCPASLRMLFSAANLAALSGLEFRLCSRGLLYCCVQATLEPCDLLVSRGPLNFILFFV